jgi:Ca2+/Na+ antiporter
VVGGQTSIDNAYLFFGLTQGYVGAITFAILLIEGLISAFRSLKGLRERQDRDFAFCLAGCLAGLAICLGTVFLNVPVYQLIFLLLGWTQSLRPMEATSEVEEPVAAYPAHNFRRVFT